MPIRHTVKQGDSLWSLANRYLGDGTRWSMIRDHHNKEVARFGPQPQHRIFAIDDPDLIFVGQTLWIPPRQKVMPPGTGEKSKAKKIATPVNLKLKYSIGRDTPPAVYISHLVEFDIKAEITGEITIELTSATQYHSNLDITLCNNNLELKQKLSKDYDPAIRELLSTPKVAFESGRVKLKTPLAPKAKADIGGYSIEVKLDAPNHMSGTVAPPAIEGKVEADGREYKYSADIEFNVDVFLHPKKRPEPGPVAETVKEKAPTSKPNQDVGIEPIGHKTKWEEMVAEEGIAVAMITVLLYETYKFVQLFLGKGMALSPTTMPPLIHEIDYRHPHPLDA